MRAKKAALLCNVKKEIIVKKDKQKKIKRWSSEGIKLKEGRRLYGSGYI